MQDQVSDGDSNCSVLEQTPIVGNGYTNAIQLSIQIADSRKANGDR